VVLMVLLETIINSSGPLAITFRESLEAALIIGIIAAYLKKTGRGDLNRYLFIGVSAAIIASVSIGGVVITIFGGLSGVSEKLFEGLASILATIVLTYMIFWMAKNSRKIKGELENRISTTVSSGYVLGISAIAFVTVIREGLETVLFLTAFAVQDLTSTILGLVIGIASALLLSFALFKSTYRLNLKVFFKYTSIILLIFGAGLIGYGTHELIEAAELSNIELGFLSTSAYDINPVDTSHTLHEKGLIGSLMKSLVGYDGNPEWLRVFVYLGYWLLIGGYLLNSYNFFKIKKRSLQEKQIIISETI